MTEYGKATIKMEAGIANPDEFTWECNCDECKEKYAIWKDAFDAEQKKLREEE